MKLTVPSHIVTPCKNKYQKCNSFGTGLDLSCCMVFRVLCSPSVPDRMRDQTDFEVSPEYGNDREPAKLDPSPCSTAWKRSKGTTSVFCSLEYFMIFNTTTALTSAIFYARTRTTHVHSLNSFSSSGRMGDCKVSILFVFVLLLVTYFRSFVLGNEEWKETERERET